MTLERLLHRFADLSVAVDLLERAADRVGPAHEYAAFALADVVRGEWLKVRAEIEASKGEA